MRGYVSKLLIPAALLSLLAAGPPTSAQESEQSKQRSEQRSERQRDEQADREDGQGQRQDGKRQEGKRQDGQRQDEQSERRAGSGYQKGQNVQVTGTVVRTRKVDLRGTDLAHLIALVKTKGGQQVPVDLGPSNNWHDVQVRTGQKITVHGHVARVGDRVVVMASRVRSSEDENDEGREISVRRMNRDQIADRHRQCQQQALALAGQQGQQGQQGRQGQPGLIRLLGNIVRSGLVPLRGSDTKHVIAQVRTSDGRLALIDLGPTSQLRGARLGAGERVEAEGRTSRFGQTPILIVSRLRCGDRDLTLRHGEQGQQDRFGQQSGQQRQQAQTGQQGRKVQATGQITGVKRVTLPGSDAQLLLVRLKTQGGRTLYASLGEESQLEDLNISSGNQVRVAGTLSTVHGQPLLVAERLSAGGRTVQIDDLGSPDAGRTSRNNQDRGQ